MERDDYAATLPAARQRRHEARRVLDPATRASILLRADHVCAYCGRRGSVHADPDGARWHMDHLDPLSRGGSVSSANVRPACAKCNAIKSGLPLDELIAHIRLMLATIPDALATVAPDIVARAQVDILRRFAEHDIHGVLPHGDISNGWYHHGIDGAQDEARIWIDYVNQGVFHEGETRAVTDE